MKMNKKLTKILLALILLTNFIQCLEVCKLTQENNCKDTKECTKHKCDGIYKYSCGAGYCSVNKFECDHLMYIKLTLSSYLGLKMHMIQNKKYQTEISSIKNCNLNKGSKTMKDPVDICMKKTDCNTKVSIFQTKDCSCKGKFDFSCGKKYCATSKKKCVKFMKTEKKNLKLNFCEIN